MNLISLSCFESKKFYLLLYQDALMLKRLLLYHIHDNYDYFIIILYKLFKSLMRTNVFDF